METIYYQTQKTTDSRVYRLLPDFNPRCQACSLGNKAAIGGHTFGKLSEVELIIVAAYPAREEVLKGYSLAPNKKNEHFDKPNAGRYLRYSLIHTFDMDLEIPDSLKSFYKKVAFTNIIKCSPFNLHQEKIDVKDNHVRICKSTWLEKEIAAVAQFNPTCPILLCGSEAVKLLGFKTKVYSNRQKIFTYNNTHPTLITFNPVEVCRYTPYKITKSKTTNKGLIYVDSVAVQKPIIVGSTSWHWLQDMKLIKKLVLENYQSRQLYLNPLAVNATTYANLKKIYE